MYLRMYLSAFFFIFFSSGLPPNFVLFFFQCDVWPEIKMVSEYTGFDLEVEEPPLDEPR